jgi:4-amino-4-deoxy-L-arabinose transferase-like glycosyltransferase
MIDLESRPPLSRAAWFVAVGIVVLLLSTAGRYGIFRDEYYYLMCADHPAWGYVDHPPLAMIFLGLWKAIFGSSVLALRIPPALLGGAVALGAALLAREMRGGAAAQVLAAVVAGLIPGVLALGSFYSMNTFDVALWVLVAWIVCRLLDPAGDRRWWWGLGVAVGIGLLNKYSMVFLGVGLGVGILLSPLRRELLSRNRLAGSLLVLVIVLPHLIWQIHHGWPTLEFIRNAHELKNVAMSPVDFWNEQLLMAHPGFLPVWLIGLTGLLLLPRLRPWRPLGVAFVVIGLCGDHRLARPVGTGGADHERSATDFVGERGTGHRSAGHPPAPTDRLRLLRPDTRPAAEEHGTERDGCVAPALRRSLRLGGARSGGT